MDMEQYKQYEPLFGSWHITKELGQGSYGTVFEIERTEFGIPYKAALKVISIPQNPNEYDRIVSMFGGSKNAADGYFRDCVQEIFKTLAIVFLHMKEHKNIVGIEDHQAIERTDGKGWDIFIRMELLTPLYDYLQQHDFKEQNVIRMGIDICKALEVCQKYNIIHRDIKPENIFFSQTGDFKLGDFFNAYMIEKGSKISDRTGVVPYMAPEIYRGEPYGFNTDIYSLGMLMYRLMNRNRLPFFPPAPQPITYADREEAVRLRMDGKAVPPPVDASRPLAEVICKACEFDPQVRYQSATEMRISLENLSKENEPVKSIRQDGKKQEEVGPTQNDETGKMPRQGFFSKLFSKKKSGVTGESIIHEICSQVKDDKIKDLFYGDIGAAEKILLSITESAFSAVTKENATLCLQIYIRAWIQSHGGLDIRFMMPDSICESAYGAFPKVERSIVKKCVDESLKVIYSHEPDLKRRIDQISIMGQYIADLTSKNVAIENKYTEDDDFGKVPAKPVFVNGFGQDRAYLDRLYTSDGVKLHNERKGSITVEGIAGPVDVYHLFLPDGQLYMEIYISNYGQHTAQASPKGTTLK